MWNGVAAADLPWWLGAVYEQLLARSTAGERRRRGSYYTPRALAEQVAARAFTEHGGRPVRTVLDPSLGAGGFLLAAHAAGSLPPVAMHGLDSDPLAVWVARIALVIATSTPPAGDAAWCARIRVGDALAPGALDGVTPDVVLGNPPWNAFSGRAAHPLDPALRREYRTRFASFAGYPTTHAMFVELCARALAPDGTLALLLPTQFTDLNGYAPARLALTTRTRVCSPLTELGFDAFAGVTEPTVLLLARAVADPIPSRAPFPLATTASTPAPVWLDRVRALPPFPPGTFRELGFRTGSTLVRTHLADPLTRTARHTVALRVGSDLDAFHLRPPSLFLDPDPSALAAARTVLHTRFTDAPVLLRQTARFPIAARHTAPCAFRNSLLAAFTDTPDALVALLNSALFRTLHTHTFREGAQAVFPQLKIAHLRALPAPPPGSDLSTLDALAREASRAQSLRAAALDALALSAGRVRKLFAPHENRIPHRADLAAAYQLDPARYDRAHATADAAWRDFVRACDRIDRAVEALYDLPDGATTTAPPPTAD